ncbi:MAG: AraC family transcriptional regulator [Candidatus Omnitrophica bacterium]|nr:AraC family transcriptional regulator [Candidatus Omnitrophota bacterium]
MKKLPIKDFATEKEREYPFDIQIMNFNLNATSTLGYHSQFEIHFFQKGEGFYLISDRRYFFYPNSIIIIKPNEVHCFSLKKEVRKYSIYFDPTFYSSISNLFFTLPHLVNLSEKDVIKIEIICKTLFEEKREKKEMYLDFVRVKLNEFFLIIYRALKEYSNKIEEDSIFREIINFIEENYDKSITIEDLAKKYHLSISSFSHQFKKYTGLSPKEYIIQRRILEAYRILTQENLKTKLVAQQVGFSNYRYFIKKFKEIIGIYPSMVKK